MDQNTKRVIKGVAKNAGKYTLKGLGKGLEFAGRGAIRTVNALVKSPHLQTLATMAGLLAAGIMIPAVGMHLIGLLGLMYMADPKPNRSIFDEIGKIVGAGNLVTKAVSDKVLSPTLSLADRGLGDLGKNVQDKIDGLFK